LDYIRFAEASPARRDTKYYKMKSVGTVDKPKTVVDENGRILLWYLPGLLLPHRVVRSAVFVQNSQIFANVAIRRR
jgi:hypothetical protein